MMIRRCFMYCRANVATFGLCAAVFISGCVDARDQAREELQRHLPRLRESLPVWYAAGAIDSIVALYDSESVLFLPGTDPIQGVDAIAAHWRKTFPDVHWNVRMLTQDLHIAPPLAVERGTFRRHASMHGSNEILLADSGQYVLTWNYGLRGWKIRHDVVIRNKE